MLYVEKLDGDERMETLSPLTFKDNAVAIKFMQDLTPGRGQIYTLMIPDGLDARGFVNWKSIIKRGPVAP